MERKHDEQLTVNEVADTYETDLEKGLSTEEANKRLTENGKNELVEKKKKNWIQIFLSQLNDPMIYVLLAATAVTIGISIFETVKALKAGLAFSFVETGDWPDVIIILAVVIVDAAIGTVQEIKASNSLDALKKMSSPESTVIRDGIRQRIKSSDLVVGDLLVIEEGDTIGADIRLIEAVNLKINESSLTGESVPVEKKHDVVFSEAAAVGDRVNLAYMSTPVSYGRGKGIVVKTGKETEIGKIADALSTDEDEQTPLQKVLARLSKTLGIVTLAIVFIVLAIDLTWIFVDGKGNDMEAFIEAILSAISLAVAAVPEGLAAVVTIVLSIGVQRMVKANTIVRKLPSVETLGGVSVVCSDKTGTLTQNKMTVINAYVDFETIDRKEFEKNGSDDLRFLAKGMSLCSNATVDEGVFGDPTEIALVAFANELGMHKKDLERESPRIDEYPFDSVRKMMSTAHDDGGKAITYTKGALDSILKHTDKVIQNGEIRDITEKDLAAINKQNENYSSQALRVLALAFSRGGDLSEENMVFVGLVAMIDPPRPEAKPAVRKLKEAGITTVMITGDHKDTAFAIAKELGICEKMSQCRSGSDIDAMTDEELKEAVKEVRVFARVSPENKVQIVKAFKGNGNIVAMTGDGVNDSPSLKAADIGIAMGITGTDVAKNAADMVLVDDNFASIEKAVEEGRGIYANIKKTVIFLLSTNITEVISMVLLIAVGLPSPFLAIHLLFVNLVTDSLPAIVLGMQPKEKDIMSQKPRNPNEGIFANGGVATIALYGLFITLGALIAYFTPAWLNGVFGYAGVKELYSNENVLKEAQTMAFTAIALSELVHMVGMSDLNHSFIHVFKEKSWMMAIALVLGVALQLMVIEVPGVSAVFSTANLNVYEWLITTAIAFGPLLLHEMIVLIKNVKKKNRG